ncbi:MULTISPECIES: hypothetical protein [unclassified Moraxella]|uniref:hypothetical protein n=1 Tax=unclassified Moraxella TaxID=2685852 RepID=UPI003AF779BD
MSLSKREQIALEVMKVLLNQGDTDVVADAFRLADEFLWTSDLTSDDAPQSLKTVESATGKTNQSAQSPTSNTEQPIRPATAISANATTPSPTFQVFSHDKSKA